MLIIHSWPAVPEPERRQAAGLKHHESTITLLHLPSTWHLRAWYPGLGTTIPSRLPLAPSHSIPKPGHGELIDDLHQFLPIGAETALFSNMA